MKNAPKFDSDSNEDVCNFIDRYVACAIPEDGCKLKELVLLLQQHKHSSYCKRGKTCRFHFPQPPSTKILIASSYIDGANDLNTISNALSKVRKELVDGNTDVTIEQLLNKAGVNMTQYERAIRTCSKGSACCTET